MSSKGAQVLRGICAAVVLFGAVLLCSIWAGLYFIVQGERQLETENALKETSNYARMFEEHTARTIRGLDQLTQFLKYQIEKEGQVVDLARFAREERFSGQLLVQLSVADETGTLMASSLVPLASATIMDREHFLIHRDTDDGKLFISKPVFGRASGKWSIQLTRRINKADGSFGGVVVVSVDPRYFAQFYKQVDLGGNSVISLVGRDGILRARQVGNDAEFGIGENVRVSSLMEKLSASPVGNFITTSAVDGHKRILGYRALQEYPLVVLVGLSEAKVFQALNERAAGYYWAGGALSVLVVLFIALLLFGIARSKRSEDALRHSAEIQSVLREISEAAIVAQSMKELYETIHRLIIRVLPAKNFYITLLDKANNQIVDGYSVDTSNVAPRRRPIGKGLTEYALRHGRTLHVTQADQERLRKSGEAISQSLSPIREWLGAPLFNAAGQSFGVMAVVSKDVEQSFQQGDSEVLSIIAAQVSLAIERKQSEEVARSSQLRYQSIVEQSSEALAVVDIQTQEVMEVNRRFTEMIGFSLPEDAPLYVNKFVVDSQSNLDSIYNVKLRRQKVVSPESRVFRHKNGTEVPVERAGTVISFEGREIYLASMRDMTEERRRQAGLIQDVELARRVQLELLPKLPESPLVAVRSLYFPSHIVSGDSYHMEWRNEGKLLRGFLIDVSGHGLATAIQTSSVNVLLREVAAAKLPLLGQMRWVNTRAAKYFTDGSYVAMLAFELDLAARELRYVGAGITQFYINGQKIETPGMFVGMWDNAEFESGVTTVAEGDCFCFLTDGFTDALAMPENEGFWSPDGQDFDADVEALERLAQSELRDDATGVCLKISSLY